MKYMKAYRPLLSVIASIITSIAMLVAVVRLAYVPGLGFLLFLAISIPTFGILTFALWPFRKRGSGKFFDGQFFFVGSAVCFVILSILGFQMFNALREATAGVTKAEKQERTEFPALAWAFDEMDKCGKGQEPYANANYRLRANCDLAVTELAKKRGVEAELSKAIQRRETLIQDSQPVAPWPLSML